MTSNETQTTVAPGARRRRATLATAVAVVGLAIAGSWGVNASAQDNQGDSTTTTEPAAEESTTTTAPEESTTTEAPTDETTPSTEAPADDPAEEAPAEEPETVDPPADESTPPTPPTEEEMQAYRDCMADNGVTLPERPKGPPAEGATPPERPDHDTLEAAREACKGLLPEGFVPGRHGPRGHHGPRGSGGEDCPNMGEGDGEDDSTVPGGSAPVPVPEAEQLSFSV